MDKRLLEEINRFKLLSGYDTKKTLTEQKHYLTEQNKKWKVWSYDGEPIGAVGPEQEYIATEKGRELGYDTYSNYRSKYSGDLGTENEMKYSYTPYDESTHKNLFSTTQNIKDVVKQAKQDQKERFDTPVLVGTATKVGQINLNGKDGVGKFKNGTLFSFYGPNDTIILGKFKDVETFKVPMGSKEITVTGETTTPPVYNTVSISFGDKVISDPFVIGQSTLKDEAKLKLDEFVTSVNDFKTEYGDEAFTKYIEFLNSKKPINVDGYASRDSNPERVYKSNGLTAAENDKILSQARAQVIVDYLETAIPEMKGILTAVGHGQTTIHGGEDKASQDASGWRATGPNDPTKFGVNRRFVINIPDFSYDKSELVKPETTTTWSKQETETSGVRPTVKDERGRKINMGTSSDKVIEKKFASQSQIDVANKVYETDLGDLVSADLAGTKLRHYKDFNGFPIVPKEEMEKVKDYIPIMIAGSFNGVSDPVTTVTSTSVTLEANGKVYTWNGWTPSNVEKDGVSYGYVTGVKLVAIEYRTSGGVLVEPDGYWLGYVGFGLRKQ